MKTFFISFRIVAGHYIYSILMCSYLKNRNEPKTHYPNIRMYPISWNCCLYVPCFILSVWTWSGCFWLLMMTYMVLHIENHLIVYLFDCKRRTWRWPIRSCQRMTRRMTQIRAPRRYSLWQPPHCAPPPRPAVGVSPNTLLGSLLAWLHYNVS